jgi:DNA repair exonuclease SbcCD ATPase subunit
MNAVVQPAANDAPHAVITLQQRARAALVVATTEDALRALAAKHGAITAITGADGRADCHSAYMEIKNTRVAIEKAGKDARDDATKFSKAVIEEEKRLVGIIEKEEERLKRLRDAWDAEEERKRIADAEREKNRVEAHQARITALRNEPSHFTDRPPAETAAAIERIRTMPIGADFEEFQQEAEDARRAVLAQLSVMQAGQQAREAEKAELERLRKAEAERQAKDAAEAQARAEAEARERTEREAKEAAARKAEEAKLAAERAELERQRREQAETFARQQAEARAQQEAEERRLAAERAELQRQRAETERKEHERQEALAARDGRIADNAERFYGVLVQLRDILVPGSPEAEIVETALKEAGLDK